MAATATALLKKYAKLDKLKRELDTKTKACKAEIEKAQPGVVEWFQKNGMESFKIDGVTIYIRRELWPGREDGIDHIQATTALEEAGLGQYGEPRVNTQGLRGIVNEHDQADEDFFKVYPGLKGIIKVSEVLKIATRKS